MTIKRVLSLHLQSKYDNRRNLRSYVKVWLLFPPSKNSFQGKWCFSIKFLTRMRHKPVQNWCLIKIYIESCLLRQVPVSFKHTTFEPCRSNVNATLQCCIDVETTMFWTCMLASFLLGIYLFLSWSPRISPSGGEWRRGGGAGVWGGGGRRVWRRILKGLMYGKSFRKSRKLSLLFKRAKI